MVCSYLKFTNVVSDPSPYAVSITNETTSPEPSEYRNDFDIEEFNGCQFCANTRKGTMANNKKHHLLMHSSYEIPGNEQESKGRSEYLSYYSAQKKPFAISKGL
jgi:hypothetical protein